MPEDIIAIEINPDERMHDCVRREEYESDIHYFIEVDYNIEFDILLDKYNFILDPDQYRELIPDDTKERYELFKASTAQYYFLEYRKEYRNFTLDKDNLSIVKGYISEIEKITDKPELNKDHSDYHNLYLSAVRFINGLSGMIRNFKLEDYSKEQIDTFLYLLHREEYFNLFPLKYDAFDMDKPDNRYRLIGENFGRYFLFADFLEEIQTTLTSLTWTPESNIVIRNKAINQKVDGGFDANIFDLVQNEYLKNFNELLKKLSEDNPLFALTSNTELHRDPKFNKYRKKIIHEITEEAIYVDESAKASTLFAWIIAYMCKFHWIEYEFNSDTTEKTFPHIAEVVSKSLFYHQKREKSIMCYGNIINRYYRILIAGKGAHTNCYTKLLGEIFSNI